MVCAGTDAVCACVRGACCREGAWCVTHEVSCTGALHSHEVGGLPDSFARFTRRKCTLAWQANNCSSGKRRESSGKRGDTERLKDWGKPHQYQHAGPANTHAYLERTAFCDDPPEASKAGGQHLAGASRPTACGKHSSSWGPRRGGRRGDPARQDRGGSCGNKRLALKGAGGGRARVPIASPAKNRSSQLEQKCVEQKCERRPRTTGEGENKKVAKRRYRMWWDPMRGMETVS